mgnify:CR=1 FL=1
MVHDQQIKSTLFVSGDGVAAGISYRLTAEIERGIQQHGNLRDSVLDARRTGQGFSRSPAGSSIRKYAIASPKNQNIEPMILDADVNAINLDPPARRVQNKG